MIGAIGNDLTTTRRTGNAFYGNGAADFADAFQSATIAATASPASFRTGHARSAETGPTVEEDESNRLNEAIAAFKKELSLTPAERVRRDVLKSMDLTEEAIDAMPAKERVEIEQKVAMEVARRMKVMRGGEAGPATAPATLP
jgi:hypothetical protein